MRVIIDSGEQLELTSLSRDAAKAVRAEQTRIDGLEDPDQAADAVAALQEDVVRQCFGDDGYEALSGSNRGFVRAFEAAMMYSMGFGEDAVKNLFGPGGTPIKNGS
jgi:hypothetical protein